MVTAVFRCEIQRRGWLLLTANHQFVLHFAGSSTREQGPPRQPSEAYSMFGSLGVPELLIIFAIILVVFGAGKLPQLGKGLGEGISNFRDGLKAREEKKQAAVEEKKNA